MAPDHGNCPNCGTSLDGGSIWQTGFEFAMAGKHYEQKGIPAASVEEAERLADEYAESYGATRTKGQWGRAIGQYCMERDRTVSWQCPDCGHSWPR